VYFRDVTHSLFSYEYKDAQYYFGSFRKWCGIKTGGYAWGFDEDISGIKNEKYVNLRIKAMQEKERYINGKSHSKGYLKIYEQAEEYLDSLNGEFEADIDDVEAAVHLDVDFMSSQRRKNAQVLMEAFQNQLLFSDLDVNDCPLFVPVLVPKGKRDELKGYLINNNIYCPVHWPVSKYHKLDEREEALYQNELSLICDQKYTEDDMWRIVDMIGNFWRGN